MIKKFLKWFVRILFVLFIAITAFVWLHPTFGGKPDAQSQEKIQQSKNHDGEIFKNLEPTISGLKKIEVEDEHAGGLLSFVFPPKGKHPSEPLPTLKFDKEYLNNGDFVWFGHSTALFKTANTVIMVDPVYYNASPVLFTVMPYDMSHRPTIDELPNIDAVLISHDHYDHLDYRAVQEMDNKVTHFYVPLGVKAHLQRWGVVDNKITEMDWYEQAQIQSDASVIDVVFTPSRHFSGRGLTNRSKTLWGSWVVKSPDLSLFFSGDSGYGKHYKEIGERFGGFDIALMEDGQYNVRWDQIHMLPEQSVQAVLDINAKYVLPVHWGKFDLSIHPWKEPIQRFLKEADKHDIVTLTPQIGQVFNIHSAPTPQTQGKWWEDVK